MVTEEEIVNRTQNRDLKDLYWELRSTILSWDKNIYVDILERAEHYFVFKRKGTKLEKRNLASFGFSKNNIYITFYIPDSVNDQKILQIQESIRTKHIKFYLSKVILQIKLRE